MVRLPVTKFKTQLFPDSFLLPLFTGVGNGKPNQTDRMMFIIHFLQQLLCQRQNHVKSNQFLCLSHTTGNLAKIMKLDFQGKRVAFEVFSLEDVQFNSTATWYSSIMTDERAEISRFQCTFRSQWIYGYELLRQGVRSIPREHS